MTRDLDLNKDPDLVGAANGRFDGPRRSNSIYWATAAMGREGQALVTAYFGSVKMFRCGSAFDRAN